MAGFIRSIVFILVAATAHRAAAADHHDAAVRIRVHDYAHIPTASLAHAQRIVSRMYEGIGVRAEWLASTRPFEDRGAAAPCGPTELTIIVLSEGMASRRTVPDSVVGYAAVTPGEAGRIAFVIYDRVRAVARFADAELTRVMGMVMAHELGHLLLPNGAHSDGGVMRAHWAAADFRHLDALDLRFSPAQAAAIRQTIGQEGAAARGARPVPGAADPHVGLLATSVDY